MQHVSTKRPYGSTRQTQWHVVEVISRHHENLKPQEMRVVQVKFMQSPVLFSYEMRNMKATNFINN
jgi:hypothetical protein